LDVTNTGDTYLDSVVISDGALPFNQTLLTRFAPGAGQLIPLPGKIRANLINTAVVTANPVLQDGTDIAGVADVTNSDSSAVSKLSFVASIAIDNTVYLGNDGGIQCGTSAAVETAKGFFGSNVTYCFTVTNTGKTSLNAITISDLSLFYVQQLSQTLAQGASYSIAVPGTISASQINYANVTANPITADGRHILDLNDVKEIPPKFNCFRSLQCFNRK
jgi:hypothetical protein